MELKKRSEMNSEYMWDLTHIFKSRELWEKEFSTVDAETDKIPSFAGTLGESAESLKAALDFITECSRRLELVFIYSMLFKAADASEAENVEMEGRATTLAVKFSSLTAFLSPEILSIPDEKLNEYMQREDMAVYRQFINDTVRAKPYTLSAEKEKMMAMLGEVFAAPSNVYDALCDVDMLLPKIKDENGEEVQLTSGNFGLFRQSRNAEVRTAAFKAMFGTYKQFANTLAANYSGEVNSHIYNARVRGFASSCEAAIFDSNVPVSVYNSLITAVHEALPDMKRYIELRKKLLGLKSISMYDMYVPMVENVELNYSYEQAKELVKKALAPLGEQYGELLCEAFSNKWIDVYENKGKTSGAFSCGVYGVHPYVLLNYAGTFDDVSTIAHELGHSMHSYKSDKAQPFVNHDYKIMVAEVASTVNEVLLTKYMLANVTDIKVRAFLLNHFLEGFRTTVFRQTLFAEFEKNAHGAAENGTPLTAEALCKIYRNLETEYYEGAEIDELVDYEWAYIPHFYRNFYVYQYATGFSAAVAIADNIIKTGNVENYMCFLQTGGSDYPLEELKIAGVDLTEPQTVKNALKVFASTIDELEALVEEL